MKMREFALSLAAVRPQPVAVAVAIDEEEFRVLYEATARPLLAYLTRASGNAETARDLLQEAYFHLLRAPRLPAESMVRRKYLFRIATNLLRDHWRRSKRDGASLEALAEPAAERNAELDCHIRGALSQLQPRERQMLWLAYVEEYDHREIAAAMGLRHASIRMLLFRARHKLAGLLRAPEAVETGKRV
jgi:RNA polymerase sigma-70 factor (ECF subfamily)